MSTRRKAGRRQGGRSDRLPPGSGDGPDWYATYRQLQNRHDQLRELGLSLPAAEEELRQRLHARLLRECGPPGPAGPREVRYGPGLAPPAHPPGPAEVRYAPGLEPPPVRPPEPVEVRYTPGAEPPVLGPA